MKNHEILYIAHMTPKNTKLKMNLLPQVGIGVEGKKMRITGHRISLRLPSSAFP